MVSGFCLGREECIQELGGEVGVGGRGGGSTGKGWRDLVLESEKRVHTAPVVSFPFFSTVFVPALLVVLRFRSWSFAFEEKEVEKLYFILTERGGGQKARSQSGQAAGVETG